MKHKKYISLNIYLYKIGSKKREDAPTENKKYFNC